MSYGTGKASLSSETLSILSILPDRRPFSGEDLTILGPAFVVPMSMAIQHVISELNRIKSAGLVADYAVGGAVAAHAYIEPSDTVDVDVFVLFTGRDTSPIASLTPIWADLVSNGAKEVGPYLEIGGWPVQLLGPGTALETDAIANAVDVPFGGLTARVMRPEHLVAIALATGRPKDYGRVEEFIRTGKVEMAKLIALIERFGLDDRWKTFQTRFLRSNA